MSSCRARKFAAVLSKMAMALKCVRKLILALAVHTVFADEKITVDFGIETGLIRPLNGVCNAAPISRSRRMDFSESVSRLEIPHYRFHDAALENPGLSLVDVSRVFPLFHADADKPENYDFRPTDDYLRSVVESGAEVEFRLGESIEHGLKTYRVNAPSDYDKWAEICCHIIRHYNDGWARGFKWNIRRWSIWEEPDTNPQLLTGAPNPFKDIYLDLYGTAARRIKKEFPDLKIGGPQGLGLRNMKLFVDHCAKNRIPLDFYGFTEYARNPEIYADLADTLRGYLDENGFKNAEIVVSEWHWGPVNWAGNRAGARRERAARAWRDDMCGADSMAFTAATLIRMQDAPVDYMYYYAMKAGVYGLFDTSGIPTGSYYAMLAFARLAHGKTRVSVPISPRAGWYFLASKDKDTGRGHVLVAAVRSDGFLAPVFLRGGVKPISVKAIDPIHDLEEVEGWTWNSDEEALFVPRLYGDSTVWLIETESIHDKRKERK